MSLDPWRWLDPSQRAEARPVLVSLAVLGSILLLVLIYPLPWTRGLAQYLPLHSALEVLAIGVSAMVFAIGWNTQKQQPSSNSLWLATCFLGVAMLDFSHMLSYAGMPDFVTPSSPEKAINFWLAARSLAAIALLGVALPASDSTNTPSRHLLLLGILFLVGVCHLMFLFAPASMPRTYVSGQGLTTFKIGFEYTLVAAYTLAGVLFLFQLGAPRRHNSSHMLGAAATMAMSEVLFTLYAEVTDTYNLLGHLYKVVAYAFLYRALLVDGVRHPYQALQASREQLDATINALPDLLFEMDENGRYLDVHANDVSALAAPSDQLRGRLVHEVLPPQAAEACMAALEEARRTGHSMGRRLSLALPFGERHFGLSVSRRDRSDSGESRYLILSRDITDIVEQERALDMEARLNRLLLALPQDARRHAEPAFLRQAAEHAAGLSGSPRALIRLVDDNQLLEPCYAWPEGLTPCPDAAPWTEALRQQRAIKWNDARTLSGDPLSRFISVPVIDDGAVRMIVSVADKAQDYTDQDLNTLLILAAAIWRLVDQLRKERQLRQQQEEQEYFFTANLDFYCICDRSGVFLRCNDSWAQTMGYPESALLGRSLLDFVHQDDREASRHALARLRDNQGVEQLAHRWRDHAGVIHHLEWRLRGKDDRIYASARDVTSRREATERIQQLSNFDQLTGLPNQQVLSRRFAHALRELRHGETGITLMWLDLDNFKAINDALGHATGDLLLQDIAQRLRDTLDESHTLCRQSGDSFMVLAPSTGQDQAAIIAASLLRALDQPVNLPGQEVIISASIGLAMYPNDGRSLEHLQMSAESAMYRVKQEGRHGFRFYTPQMQVHSTRTLALDHALKFALARDELSLNYQPKRCLRSGQLVGVEALLRWQTADWGPVSPAEFIPLAESSGLIVPIGDWVLHQAAAQARRWQEAGLSDFSLAINLSAAQFSQPDLARHIRAIMDKHGVDPARITLELTEAVALRDPEAAASILEQLRAAGFGLSLDDFGTGYSSMSYLRRFAVDELKIDQSFIRELDHNADDQAIVTAIIQMAHSLGMRTVAEGVENEAQATFLSARDCDEIQGHLFSPALSAEALQRFVQGQHVAPMARPAPASRFIAGL